MRTQLASPAEWHLQLRYGMTIILEGIYISPTEAIRQEINHICNIYVLALFVPPAAIEYKFCQNSTNINAKIPKL